jgi:hypothetical protein
MKKIVGFILAILLLGGAISLAMAHTFDSNNYLYASDGSFLTQEA